MSESTANVKTIAETLELNPRRVRLSLRKLEKKGEIERPSESGWAWPSEKDPDYKTVLKLVKTDIETNSRTREEEPEEKPAAKPAPKGKPEQTETPAKPARKKAA